MGLLPSEKESILIFHWTKKFSRTCSTNKLIIARYRKCVDPSCFANIPSVPIIILLTYFSAVTWLFLLHSSALWRHTNARHDFAKLVDLWEENSENRLPDQIAMGLIYYLVQALGWCSVPTFYIFYFCSQQTLYALIVLSFHEW